MMISKKVQIINNLGLHARPAVSFITMASKFESDIYVVCKDKKANAKSILNILDLLADKNHILEIVAEGKDESEAVEALAQLVQNGFNEV